MKGSVPARAGLPSDLSSFDWVLEVQAMKLKGQADYIVRDMRLLMVGEVRILNKEIIEEPHKRPAHGQDGSTVHDPKDG